MTHVASPSTDLQARAARARGGGWLTGPQALALWHAAWAVGSALLAMLSQWAQPVAEGATPAALLIMAAPGVAGLLLMWRDDPPVRLGLLCFWALATGAAAGLTGGVGGAAPGLVALPLAAGIALDHPRFGDDRLTHVGGLASALAVVCGLISNGLNPPQPPMAALTALSVLLSLVALATAVRIAGAARAERERQALAAAAETQAFLHGQPSLTLMIETDGRVLAAYGAAPPALSVRDLVEQGLVAAVHGPDRAAVAAALARAAGGQDAEVVFAPRQALDRRVGLVLRRLPGDPPRLVAQAFDAAAQYARELRLEAARAEAEAQNAGKTRFLATMSHELRTPLNAVIGFSDIMRQGLFGPLPDRYADYAESIHQAGGHLLALINDVLDLSKIDAARYQLALEDFDARDPVSEAIALMRLQAADKGVELAGVLPDAPLPVTADRRAVKQIALNLMSNAVKFTPAGGSVTVTLEGLDDAVELSVADTGVGIAPEDLQRLGRPFEQAGGADQRAQGTGLGLSLVRSLTELHGGRTVIDSTLGEGTAISVRLPSEPTAA
ncbi:HAMP domain-containing sensor histidine kinase [Brevundimonas sp.]|uniref:sensor histidine kinase n=2 Tax=Brevundimonas TaxID=41275 RepID=UPI0025BFC9FA|nr:HAMP domain-containing sensor histidine kinase [Brevundimonas sp.]